MACLGAEGPSSSSQHLDALQEQQAPAFAFSRQRPAWKEAGIRNVSSPGKISCPCVSLCWPSQGCLLACISGLFGVEAGACPSANVRLGTLSSSPPVKGWGRGQVSVERNTTLDQLPWPGLSSVVACREVHRRNPENRATIQMAAGDVGFHRDPQLTAWF